MPKNKHKVLIAGGGFGGVKTALALCRDERFDITLLSDHPDFRVYGTLYHVATGGSRKISSIPLTEIFAGKDVRIVIDKISAIDRQARAAKTESGQTYAYDALVLGLGMQTNYFNIKGLKQYSFGIKSITEAEKLKRHIHAQLLADHKPDLNYVVVGGGPTGVELAGVLPEYIKHVMKRHGVARRAVHVDLIEAAPRLLPRMPKDVSLMVKRHLKKIGVKVYLKTAVQAQTADALMVNNKPIRSHTVIWTAGFMNNPFFASQQFQQTRQGKVRVDQYLQAEPGIYVIGDNADTPYAGMAQTALHDGHYVAENLKRLADGEEPKPYVAKKPIYVMPAGPKWAAVLWGKFRIYGRLGWWLRRAADFMAFKDYEPFGKAFERFMAENEHQEFCPHCVDEFSKLNYLSGEA